MLATQQDRLGLIARIAGVLLGLLALGMAAIQPAGLPWLPLTCGLLLVGIALLVLGWRATRSTSNPPLAFMTTISQLPGDLWKPTQQLRWWRSEAPDEPAPRAPPTSPQAKARIQQVLRDAADTEPMVRPELEPTTIPAQLDLPTPANAMGKSTHDQPKRATQPRHWRLRVWQDIEWRRFVTVVTGLFYQVGFRPQQFRAVGRTGADVCLTSGKGQLMLRCMATRVGIDEAEIDAFARVMASRGMTHGTLVCNGAISAQARARAAELHIHTLDGKQLLDLIALRTPAQREVLLNTAYAGAYWRPTCVRCGIKLVERVRPQDRRPYWGCRNAPSCDVVLPLDMKALSQSR